MDECAQTIIINSNLDCRIYLGTTTTTTRPSFPSTHMIITITLINIHYKPLIIIIIIITPAQPSHAAEVYPYL